MAEKVVASRMDDRERAARAHRRPNVPAATAGPPERRPHGALTRHVGSLLIAAGQRLAGPSAVPAQSSR